MHTAHGSKRAAIAQALGQKQSSRSVSTATAGQLNKRRELQDDLAALGISCWRSYCNMAHGKLRVKFYNVYALDEREVVRPLTIMQCFEAGKLGLTEVFSADGTPSFVIYID